MKLLSKIQLIALALEAFKMHPNEKTCFAREDGNIFFTENYAELGRGKMKVYQLSKSDVEDQKKEDADKKESPAKEADVKNLNPLQKPDVTLGKEGKNPETRTAKETK